MKLLVIEDEVKTARTLQKGLEEKGYTVELAYDGETALLLANNHSFDLIITDIIIPRINGLEFCRRFREKDKITPVIMLTALGLTADKIKGFDSGGDDYIVKPFDFEELLARIKVHLNRVNLKSRDGSFLIYANLKINQDTKEVFRDDTLITLTAKEYSLLEYFMKNRNKVISKEDIAEKVWSHDFDTGTNIIEVYVSYLRNKIDKGFEPKLIHTKKGMGYIFREEK
jgi:two-component system, OmpR family, copper resistance phosphate regulon response regulator CusR